MDSTEIFEQMSSIGKVRQLVPSNSSNAMLDEKIAAHRGWLQSIHHERPSPAKQYKIGVYIRYFNQTRYRDYASL